MVKTLRIIHGLIRMARDSKDYARVERFRKVLRGYGYFRRGVDRVVADPATQPLMTTKPLLAIDVERLHQLPAGTLGRDLMSFLDRNGLRPLSYVQDPSLTDEEFFIRRVVQTHDIWHVLLGFDTDELGELGINSFMLAQIAWPPAGFYIAGYLLRQMFANPADAPAIIASVARGWRQGQLVKPLFAMRWEDNWERPVDELRRELGIELAPAARAA